MMSIHCNVLIVIKNVVEVKLFSFMIIRRNEIWAGDMWMGSKAIFFVHDGKGLISI